MRDVVSSIRSDVPQSATSFLDLFYNFVIQMSEVKISSAGDLPVLLLLMVRLGHIKSVDEPKLEELIMEVIPSFVEFFLPIPVFKLLQVMDIGFIVHLDEAFVDEGSIAIRHDDHMHSVDE